MITWFCKILGPPLLTSCTMALFDEKVKREALPTEHHTGEVFADENAHGSISCLHQCVHLFLTLSRKYSGVNWKGKYVAG